MKNNFLLFLFLILVCTGIYGQTQHASFKEIPIKIEDIFLQTNSNKPIFLEAFLPTCGHCMAYNETFQDSTLKTYLQKNFNAYQLDLSKKENQDFLKKRKIYVYSTPTFLVFGPKGELLNFDSADEEFNSIEGIKTLLNKSISKEKNHLSLLKKFTKEKLSKSELLEIGTFTRFTLDTNQNIKIVNEITKLLNPTEFESELGFKIIQKMMLDEENILFDHFISHLKNYQLYADSVQITHAAENVLMNSLYNPNAKNYSFERLEKMKKSLIKLGIPAKSVATRFIYYEVLKYVQLNDQKSAIAKIKSYYQNKAIPTKEKDFWCNTLKQFNSKQNDCPL